MKVMMMTDFNWRIVVKNFLLASVPPVILTAMDKMTIYQTLFVGVTMAVIGILEYTYKQLRNKDDE